jgi:hypothetical protein
MENRTCRVCGCVYLWDYECGSDLGCCCSKCEDDWLAFEADMEKEPFSLFEWEDDIEESLELVDWDKWEENHG